SAAPGPSGGKHHTPPGRPRSAPAWQRKPQTAGAEAACAAPPAPSRRRREAGRRSSTYRYRFVLTSSWTAPSNVISTTSFWHSDAVGGRPPQRASRPLTAHGRAKTLAVRKTMSGRDARGPARKDYERAGRPRSRKI